MRVAEEELRVAMDALARLPDNAEHVCDLKPKRQQEENDVQLQNPAFLQDMARRATVIQSKQKQGAKSKGESGEQDKLHGDHRKKETPFWR